MAAFPNGTLGHAGLRDMEHLRDMVTAGGSGRSIYPPVFNNGYYYPMGPNITSVGDVFIGVAVIGIIFIVVYYFLALIMRLHSRFYYGVRKKRSLETNPGNSDALFGVSNSEPWWNGQPNLVRMKRMKNGEDPEQLQMTAKIMEAIEETSLDYED